MTQLSLQTLTWGTIGAAVASALWLASAGDDGLFSGREGAPAMLRVPAQAPSIGGAALRRPGPDQRDGRATAGRGERRTTRPAGS
ncbi:hypothetical protein [Caldimonas sp. KR1-144]|uniref:hypothetical protein n=1 Tax=Caldimonas sp. KR1-144 TaxID=3400911 RepID=UPI003C0523EE